PPRSNRPRPRPTRNRSSSTTITGPAAPPANSSKRSRLMTDLAEQPTSTAEPEGTQPAAPAQTKRRRPPIGLFGIPIAVGIVLLCWVIWRLNADLTSVDLVTLEWSSLAADTLEHLKLTVVGTLIVVAIAVPLGIVLTRPGLRRAAPVVVAIANGGQAAPSIGLLVLLAM